MLLIQMCPENLLQLSGVKFKSQIMYKWSQSQDIYKIVGQKQSNSS